MPASSLSACGVFSFDFSFGFGADLLESALAFGGLPRGFSGLANSESDFSARAPLLAGLANADADAPSPFGCTLAGRPRFFGAGTSSICSD